MKEGFISVNDGLPNEFEVVLTMHENDLYPVCAYLYDKDRLIWCRETEGPEDEYITGKNRVLYRPPTHFMYLNELPKIKKTEKPEQGELFDK